MPLRRAITLGCLFLFCAPLARPQQAQSGTIIVAGFSQDFIVVAADSVATNADTGQRILDCKIDALNHKFIFAPAGTVVLQVVNQPNLKWDALDAVGEALRSIGPSTSFTGSQFALAVAEAWGKLAVADLDSIEEANSAAFWSEIGDHREAAGFFGTLDSAGNISVAATIVAIDRSRGISARSGRPLATNAPMYIAFGETQIFDEFDSSKTPRAKQEFQRWSHATLSLSPLQKVISRAVDLVQLSIDYLPPRADMGGSGVGGPVHAMYLARGGTVHWVKGRGCPAKSPTGGNGLGDRTHGSRSFIVGCTTC